MSLRSFCWIPVMSWEIRFFKHFLWYHTFGTKNCLFENRLKIIHYIQSWPPDVKKLTKVVQLHSMDRANLNKSEVFLTNTSTASKYIGGPESASIEIPHPFQTQIYLVKVCTSKYEHSETRFTSHKIVIENFMKWWRTWFLSSWQEFDKMLLDSKHVLNEYMKFA